MSFSAWIAIVVCVGLIIGFLWFLGYNYSRSDRMLAKREAENANQRAENEARAKEIMAKPKPDTWRDTVDGL